MILGPGPRCDHRPAPPPAEEIPIAPPRKIDGAVFDVALTEARADRILSVSCPCCGREWLRIACPDCSGQPTLRVWGFNVGGEP